MNKGGFNLNWQIQCEIIGSLGPESTIITGVYTSITILSLFHYTPEGRLNLVINISKSLMKIYKIVSAFTSRVMLMTLM